MKLLPRAICATLVILCATAWTRGRVVISLDFSQDRDGLFDSSPAGLQAQAAMQRAAQVLSDRIVDNLTAITPGGGNTWSPRMTNPGTGLDAPAPLTGVAANTIKIYVGSRSLTATELGNAVAGYGTSTGSPAFNDNAASRGQAGALTTPKTDYGPWGGSIAFDSGTNWYFGLTTGGLTGNKVDFLTVATHELAHLFGFSATQPSWAALISGGKFTGAKAIAANGGVAPAVTGSHWLSMNSTVGSPTGPSQIALMDGGVATGVRRHMTLLDWAAIDDLGWDLALPGDANADGVVNFPDFQALELGYGETNARWSQGDFNEDGVVDMLDLSILLKNYGKRFDAPPGPGAAVAVDVPEPGAVAILLGIALVVINGRRR